MVYYKSKIPDNTNKLPILRYSFLEWVWLITGDRYEADLVTKDQGQSIEVGLLNKRYNYLIFYRIWLGYPYEVIENKLKTWVSSREILFRRFMM